MQDQNNFTQINTQQYLIQKSIKIVLSFSPASPPEFLSPASNNTFIVIFLENGILKIMHIEQTGKIIAETIIKQEEYQVFMMSDNFVTVIEYSLSKPVCNIVQWNLQTHESIVVPFRRQILPRVKVFTFRESQTFCICQYDHHGEQLQTVGTTNNLQNAQNVQINKKSYHTKYKLSYFKFPIKKQTIKPHMVFKTHTNPKQYGFNQQILKLNEHSMIGSICSKTDEKDETLLKTFDFRNNPMGMQINYKFHVQICYRKDLLQLWIADMWELRQQELYLKCQLRKKDGLKEGEGIEQTINLTWAYKTQTQIKFSKFKTPFLSEIQFLDGFNLKQRKRLILNKNCNAFQQINNHLTTANNQKLIKNTNQTEHYFPLYYISNQTEQIVFIDKFHSNWSVSYPSYECDLSVFYRYKNAKNQNQEIQINLVKVWNSHNLKQICAFFLESMIGAEKINKKLVQNVLNLLQDTKGMRHGNDWTILQMNKTQFEENIKKKISQNAVHQNLSTYNQLNTQPFIQPLPLFQINPLKTPSETHFSTSSSYTTTLFNRNQIDHPYIISTSSPSVLSVSSMTTLQSRKYTDQYKE